ncbi:MAG TPA: superinfection immunity protein, partial [Acidobacteriaceae bacterium]|nr:superinfection immunity protein [Acidobacteriaceae bacterium]
MIASLTLALILQFWAFVILGGLIYWLPSIVALAGHSNRRVGVMMVNFLFGWTIIGWLGALTWAIATTTG